MDYQVIYHPEHNKRYPLKKDHKIKVQWIGAAVLLLLGILLLKPTPARLHTMVKSYQKVYDFNIIADHMRQGESLGDSVTAFCLHVLRNAEVS